MYWDTEEKLLCALQLLDASIAYLSIQASSGSAEQLFGDAGVQEEI